ncbi:hypothetical protein [Sphingobium sp. R-7]|uniref:hypothetical protein n=1 Tax=Sphingobium sp. R-7 TaxID=3375449 RepID=UPI00398A7353
MEGNLMSRYTWLVLTNAEPGREEEFNRWYNDVHVPDLLRIPGVVGVSRGRLGGTQTKPGPVGIEVVETAKSGLPYQYLASYTIETDDLETVLRTVAELAGTPDMVMSDALSADITTMCFEEINLPVE